MYYNYYATQVMHQYGGEPWKKWNAKMRDYLVSSARLAPASRQAGSHTIRQRHLTALLRGARSAAAA